MVRQRRDGSRKHAAATQLHSKTATHGHAATQKQNNSPVLAAKTSGMNLAFTAFFVWQSWESGKG